MALREKVLDIYDDFLQVSVTFRGFKVCCFGVFYLQHSKYRLTCLLLLSPHRRAHSSLNREFRVLPHGYTIQHIRVCVDSGIIPPYMKTHTFNTYDYMSTINYHGPNKRRTADGFIVM